MYKFSSKSRGRRKKKATDLMYYVQQNLTAGDL